MKRHSSALISTLAFAGLLAWNRQSIAVSRRELGLLLLNGGLLGAYLILFFFAVEVSNASVAMAGLSTIVLWSAVLEPLMVRGRKLQSNELLLGLCSAALWIMFAGGLSLSSGLLLSVLSALLTAIYMFLNARLVQRHASRVVSFYSMAGAALVSLLAMPLYAARLGNWSFLTWPTVNVWLAILTLSLVCTVCATICSTTSRVDCQRSRSISTASGTRSTEFCWRACCSKTGTN